MPTKTTSEPVAAVSTVSDNPAMVEFPRDPWGMTAQLRKFGLQACSNVRGDAEKHKILLDTLRVLAQHAVVRLPKDKAMLAARIQGIKDRPPGVSRQATNGVAVPTA